jgi:hypothetical protein
MDLGKFFQAWLQILIGFESDGKGLHNEEGVRLDDRKSGATIDG